MPCSGYIPNGDVFTARNTGAIYRLAMNHSNYDGATYQIDSNFNTMIFMTNARESNKSNLKAETTTPRHRSFPIEDIYQGTNYKFNLLGTCNLINYSSP